MHYFRKDQEYFSFALKAVHRSAVHQPDSFSWRLVKFFYFDFHGYVLTFLGQDRKRLLTNV